MFKRKNREIDFKAKRKVRETRLPLMRLEPVSAWPNILCMLTTIL